MVRFWVCVKTVPTGLDDIVDVVCEKERGMVDDSKIFGLNE